MRIDRITTSEFKKIVSGDVLLIFPIGATEAHGIHLPLGTDTFQAEYVADGIAEKLGNVIVAPVLPYGNHSSLKDVAGTVNLTFDTLRSVIIDVIGSFIHHGIRKILIINGHAGTSHLAAVTEACRDLVSTNDVKIMSVADYYIAQTSAEFNYDGDGHGGLAETSRMLAINADIVKKERPKGKFVDANCMILKDATRCMPDGIVGDTSKASASLGKKMNDYIVDTLIEMMEREMQ